MSLMMPADERRIEESKSVMRPLFSFRLERAKHVDDASDILRASPLFDAARYHRCPSRHS
jgi:hypothetical protein